MNDTMTTDEQDELLYQMYSTARKLGGPKFAYRIAFLASACGFNVKSKDVQAWSERFEEDEY